MNNRAIVSKLKSPFPPIYCVQAEQNKAVYLPTSQSVLLEK